MKVHVVIPAGGLGTRFNNTEFKELKPFIKINNKTMFEYLVQNVLNNSININVYISIIIQESYKDQYINDIRFLESKYNLKFYYINKLTEGTTCTALFLYDLLNNEDFTLLMNCDQVVDISLNEYINEHIKLDAFGSLLCFDKETSTKWSFVDVEDKYIKRVVAKDNISDIAVCGWYAWSRGKDFIKYGIKQIINQDKVNGEYYLCPIYNYAIKDGKKIGCIMIDKESMHGLGTPSDLRFFLKFLSK